MNLDTLRKRIDEIDTSLVTLLNERIKDALEIGKLKNQTDQEIYVPVREKAVLDRVVSQNQGPLTGESLRAIYREIMSAAISLEREVSIAHFGQPATFTHQAARSRFGASVNYQSYATVDEVFTAVENRVADYGVVPIENSSEGPVNPTLDALSETPLKIYAEICLPIEHHLMSRAGPEAITTISSHPQVLGQCRHWLARQFPGAELLPSSSTAKAAEMASQRPDVGALASDLAAELYGLTVHHSKVQDQAGNATRFLVLARRFGDPTGEDKTSVVFKVRHKVGALFEALSPFQRAELNMTKIESRPSRQKAWEYWFFVDFEGHVEEERVQAALEELETQCMVLNVLGSYPVANLPS
jgi:chorismate mutase/prephenate dehydratase